MAIIKEVLPDDKYNRELVGNAHPDEWVNPEPSGRYNLVVVGAGTAGLVTAAGAAGVGAKVALIERYLMGGDCLNYGCVPSKAIIRSSRAVKDINNAGEFGVDADGEARPDFGAVMERMRRLRAEISHNDSVKRFSDLGIDVFMGEAKFVSGNEVEVDGKRLKFKKAVIATGARAVELPIPGLSEAGFLTNENIFTLTERPGRLAVIGGGPIGSEMAQAFRRLGSDVALLDMAPHILIREDADAAEIAQKAFIEEGVRLILEAAIKKVEKRDGAKIIHFERNGAADSVEVDEILVGVGRAPNVDDLGLEAAGVEYGKFGVKVDDNLRSTNPNIYAAGDAALAHKFTHTADASARIVIQNALFMGRKKLSALTVPWVTYTDPEIAHVGMYEKDARDRGLEVDTYTVALDDVDRAVLDGESDGFVRIHTRKGSDKILGATIVARHAGEMISELSLAIVNDIGLGKITAVIHPYPTQAEAIKRAADAYSRSRLTPFISKLFKKWMEWTR